MTESRRSPLRYSAVVPVGARIDALEQLIREYAQAFDTFDASYEIVVVLDGPQPEALASLRGVAADNRRVRILQLSRPFGESSALMAGFDAARGELLVTLPAHYQIDPKEIPKLLAAQGQDDDMLVAVRWPRMGNAWDRARRDLFHRLFGFVSRMRYRDLGCGVRLLTRSVADEIVLYGDHHRFFPALAARRGFHVREVELAQSPNDVFRGRYRLRDYLHRLLDVLTVFFLVRFTKKPLRFFGTIGFLAAGFGGIVTAVLVFRRLVFDTPLADRPALLLGSLLVVLGVQVFALGLIGELIIFTHANRMKEYAIRAVVQRAERSTDSSADAKPDVRIVG